MCTPWPDEPSAASYQSQHAFVVRYCFHSLAYLHFNYSLILGHYIMFSLELKLRKGIVIGGAEQPGKPKFPGG